MPTRFVILHHRQPDGEHWDLMLENEGVLLTWQLLSDPADVARRPIAARHIGDHRLAYLDYEGPLSGNRGAVRREDRGTLEIQQMSSDLCRFELKGSHWSGSFELRRHPGGQWTFFCQ